MLHRKVKDGDRITGTRGEESFSVCLRRIGRGAAIVDIEAPGWDVTFEPGEGLDEASSDLTTPPRSG